MDYKKGDVCSFLLQYQVQKGSDFTHTSIVKPTGSFYIPSEKLDNFFEIYKKGVNANDDLYITEKHRDISPFLIDLDFRFEKTQKLERIYTENDIINIVKLYVKYIKEYIEIENDFDIFVMQKPFPVIDKEIVKDGLHIVIPEIVTKPNVQYIIRKRILEECDTILGKLNLKNSYEDVFDEAVIERNNWQMYGSKKPNCERYKITKIFNCSKSNDELIEKEIDINDNNYIDLLSIRNKYDGLNIKIDKQNEIVIQEQEQQKKKKNKIMGDGILQTTQNMKKNICDNMEYVNKLVEILSENRANIYIDWIRVGWCLRNIDYRLLEIWINFSKKSPKFNDGECEKVWNYMKDDGLGIGTLHMWAKQDNLEQYKTIIKKDLSNLVFRSKNETHHDIAQVIHFMFKYDYVCVSIKNNLWYEFRNNRWVVCDSGYGLRGKISTDVCKEYLNHAGIWNQKGSTEDDESEQQRCAEIGKKLNGIAIKLKQGPFIDNIMKECKYLFYVEKFEEKLDSRTNLIGFENGVYDLETFEFREGRPEDYISFSTNISYLPYDETHQISKEVDNFMSKVLVKSHMKEYVLLLLSSFLNGGIKEERFHIWTGSGCFAKGTQVMMFDGKNKSIENIKEGELLMGDDSTPRTVQQLFRGYSDMYRIKPVKGEDFVVNGGHDLVVKMSNCFKVNKREYDHYRASWVEYVEDKNDNRVIKNISRSVPTKEEVMKILEDAKISKKSVKVDDIVKMTVHQYLELPKSIKVLMSVYRPDIVNFEKKDTALDPYLLGYWLGDGSQYDSSFTTEDIQVVDYVKELMEENDCEMDVYDDNKTYGIRANRDITKVNYVRKGLQKYDLFKNKHIPYDFKVNDKETRLSVLAGIVDSDGHYQKKMKQIEITLKSEKLIDDVIWLARSLGLSCYKSKIKKKCCNNGPSFQDRASRKVGDYFRINMVGKSLCEIPTKIPRKKPDMRTHPTNPLKLSFKVERIEDDNFYGFELDGNNRFLLGNFIVQKNSNGKSKTIDLFEQAFGDYCCKLPITLLTQKRAASNAATSELARTKGKRFACLQEPSEDEKLNVGLMKELTGGDKIQARQIYKEPIEFKPQFKMILTCNNLPNVPSDDGGTWRRIRVVEFQSKFTDAPNPERENEFLADTDLSEKFAIWKEYFMGMLIEYYKKYRMNGITEPDEVLQCTKEYQKNNDIFLEFVEQEFEKQEDEFVSFPDIVSSFKSWGKNNNINIPSINLGKKNFTKVVSKTLGPGIIVNKLDGWKGWTFKKTNNLINDDLD